MTTDETALKALDPTQKPHRFKTVILVLSLVLPVAGLTLTYFYPLNSYQYWVGLMMVASMGVAAFYASHAHHMGYFEEIVLVLAFLLSLTGLGLTNFSPTTSLRFWVAMTVFLATAAVVIGSVRNVAGKGKETGTIVAQLFHWAATGGAVLGIFLLLRAGRLNYDNTGLVLLLVLGLSTFLDGYRISWRLSLIGVLVGGTAILAAFIEQFIWPVILLALVLLVIAIFWEKHRFWAKHRQARRSGRVS